MKFIAVEGWRRDRRDELLLLMKESSQSFWSSAGSKVLARDRDRLAPMDLGHRSSTNQTSYLQL